MKAEFKADAKFNAYAYWRYYTKYGKKALILLLVLWISLQTISITLAKHYWKECIYLAIFWLVYPVIVLLPSIIAILEPKTYRITYRGLYINNAFHSWKNFHSYFSDEKYIYIVKKLGKFKVISVILPKCFSEEISKVFKFRET